VTRRGNFKSESMQKKNSEFKRGVNVAQGRKNEDGQSGKGGAVLKGVEGV